MTMQHRRLLRRFVRLLLILPVLRRIDQNRYEKDSEPTTLTVIEAMTEAIGTYVLLFIPLVVYVILGVTDQNWRLLLGWTLIVGSVVFSVVIGAGLGIVLRKYSLRRYLELLGPQRIDVLLGWYARYRLVSAVYYFGTILLAMLPVLVYLFNR